MQNWVLIRGLTRERAHWGAFVQTLEQALPDARVLCADLPGAGTLVQQASPLRVQAMVQSCRQQLLAGGHHGPFHLLGLSLGGMVAAEWARLWPDEVATCVLVNTSMRPYSPPQRRLRLGLLPTLLRILMTADPQRAEAAVLRLTSAAPERHLAVLPAWTALRRQRPVTRSNALRQLLAAAGYRWQGAPPRPPVLVVCSAADALVAPACSHLLAQAFKAPLLVHPQAGHDLPLDDGPWLAAQIRRWQADPGRFE